MSRHDKGYPKPQREMTVEEHKDACTIMLNAWPEPGDDLLRDLMVLVYPQERQQHN